MCDRPVVAPRLLNPAADHRDGLERITVKDTARAQDLYHTVMEEMSIPQEGLVISKQQQLVIISDQKLLTFRQPDQNQCLPQQNMAS